MVNSLEYPQGCTMLTESKHFHTPCTLQAGWGGFLCNLYAASRVRGTICMESGKWKVESGKWSDPNTGGVSVISLEHPQYCTMSTENKNSYTASTLQASRVGGLSVSLERFLAGAIILAGLALWYVDRPSGGGGGGGCFPGSAVALTPAGPR